MKNPNHYKYEDLEIFVRIGDEEILLTIISMAAVLEGDTPYLDRKLGDLIIEAFHPTEANPPEQPYEEEGVEVEALRSTFEKMAKKIGHLFPNANQVLVNKGIFKREYEAEYKFSLGQDANFETEKYTTPDKEVYQRRLRTVFPDPDEVNPPDNPLDQN